MLQTEKRGIIAKLPGPAAKSRGAAAGLTRAEWLVLVALAAVQFTHIVDFMIVMPLGPELNRELTLDPQQFSVIVAVYGISASLASLSAARFMDRFDRKKAVLCLYTGFTLGTLLCALAPNYWFLLAARAVAGAFGGVVASGVLAIVGDLFPDARRGRANGIVMLAFSVASIAGVPTGLFIANELGWRAPFAVLAGLSIAVLLAAYAVLPAMRGHLSRGDTEVASTPWSVLLQPGLVRAYLLMITLVFSSFMIMPFLADYLVFNVGIGKENLPFVYLCGGLATLLTMPCVGWLSDAWGKLPVFRVFALLTMIPLLLLTNLPPVPLVVVLLISTLFMITTSSRMVPAMALITASAQPRYRGSFLSLNGAVQQMALGLASMLGGQLLDKTAEGHLIGYPLVGGLALVAVLASVWLAGHLRPAAGGEDAAVVLAAD